MAKRLTIYVGLIAAIVGGMWKLDTRYAKTEDVYVLQREISGSIGDVLVEIVGMRIEMLRERIWEIEDDYGSDPERMPREARDQYRHLMCEKEAQEMRLSKILNGRLKR